MDKVDLTTREGVCALLNTCETAEDWNENVGSIKKANGGSYPDFWYELVILNGLCDTVAARWGGSSGITITANGRDNS